MIKNLFFQNKTRERNSLARRQFSLAAGTDHCRSCRCKRFSRSCCELCARRRALLRNFDRNRRLPLSFETDRERSDCPPPSPPMHRIWRYALCESDFSRVPPFCFYVLPSAVVQRFPHETFSACRRFFEFLLQSSHASFWQRQFGVN